MEFNSHNDEKNCKNRNLTDKDEMDKKTDPDVEITKESCPNPDCAWHESAKVPKEGRWYLKHGYYESLQHGKIARYMCLNCHRTFSARTDNENFYLHFDEYDIREIGMEYYSGVTQKDIARKHGITVQMVRTRIKRFNPYIEGLFLDWGVAEPEPLEYPEKSDRPDEPGEEK